VALEGEQWEHMVEDFTTSLQALHDVTRATVPFTEETLQESTLGAGVVELADAHLGISAAIRGYLDERIEDDDAKRALGIAAVADIQAAHFLAASEEPFLRSRLAFEEVKEDFDVNELKVDLLHIGAIAGGQDAPPALVEVKNACDRILKKTESLEAALFTKLASLTVDQLLDGLESLLGDRFAEAIRAIRLDVGRIRKRALDFINEAITKLAKLLGEDWEKIKEQLKNLWAKLQDLAQARVEDALGHSEAMGA
jgi:hypothetical protein